MGDKKRIKSWFLTYPQCKATKEDLLAWLELIDDVIEYVICMEKHKDEGEHLHAHVRFRTGVFEKEFRKFDMPFSVGHYEPTRSREKAIRYCKKDGDWISNLSDDVILTPELKRAKFVHNVLTVKSVPDMIKDGDIRFDQAKPALLAKQLLSIPKRREGVCGIWIQGKPGVGKSHKARHDYGDSIYVKPMNKWWCGYNNEKVVLLDDFEKSAGPMLAHYIKIWADKWECTGETKGGQVCLNYDLFIVTSNYTIAECFGPDEDLVAAIARRFEIINM